MLIIENKLNRKKYNLVRSLFYFENLYKLKQGPIERIFLSGSCR